MKTENPLEQLAGQIAAGMNSSQLGGAASWLRERHSPDAERAAQQRRLDAYRRAGIEVLTQPVQQGKEAASD